VAPDQFFRQPELGADLANLVFEEFLEGFDKFAKTKPCPYCHKNGEFTIGKYERGNRGWELTVTCACGASGIVNESQLCMVAGTWGNNQYISRTPVVDEDVFMTSCYSIPDYYLMLEGSATSASNLEWFVTQFFEAEQNLAKQSGKSVYELCNDLVGGTEPQEANITFLPFLFGSNVNPDAKSCFIGLSGWHNRGHVLRAIYEGVVFAHMAHVERLLKFREMPETIRLTGGASQSRVWVQIFADCFQTPVEIPEGTELGALGAAIAAGVASGCYRSYEEAIEHMVRFSQFVQPDQDVAETYAAKYERYKKVLTTLAPVWKDFR